MKCFEIKPYIYQIEPDTTLKLSYNFANSCVKLPRLEVVINSIGSHKYNDSGKSRDCWTMIMDSSVYNFGWPPTARDAI